MSAWSAPSKIRDSVQRRWNKGDLLQALAEAQPFPEIQVPLTGPKPSEIGHHLGEVQAWVTSLVEASRAGSRFELRWKDVGGRVIGRNRIPVRAVISSYEQAWELLGTQRQVRRFAELIELSEPEPGVAAWLRSHPLRALELAERWPALLAAYRWLEDHRDSGLYLRQITAPGVDTKFMESHRGVLAALLGIPGGSSTAQFAQALGLRAKPSFVRFRVQDVPGMIGGVSEYHLRLDEAAQLGISPSRAVIVENEITYLSMPVPAGGLVIWGKGYDGAQLGALPFLADRPIDYWGDLDTHGFAILDRLRSHLPQARSFLMDEATLLAHRERWGEESYPTSAALPRLTPEESAVYEGLVSEHYGSSVRLEQERIAWDWAQARFPNDLGATPH